jgi:hypothetical protein
LEEEEEGEKEEAKVKGNNLLQRIKEACHNQEMN